jgi:ribosomal protein S27AE
MTRIEDPRPKGGSSIEGAPRGERNCPKCGRPMTATLSGWRCRDCGYWEPVPPAAEGRWMDADSSPEGRLLEDAGECLAAQLLRAHDRLRQAFPTARAYEIPSSALALQWWRAARRREPWWRRWLPPPEGRVVNRSAEAGA